MVEEFVIERAERKQARLRLALAGSSGGGKTTGALLVARGIVETMLEQGLLSGTIEGKIGVIDTERKSAQLYSHLVPFDTIPLAPPYSPERYVGALHALERVGCAVIILDQISHAWAGDGGILALLSKFKANANGNEFSAWQNATPVQDGFVDSILQSPAHIICTMRSKTEWVLEEQVNRSGRTVKVPKRVGMKPIQREGIEYEFTTMLQLDPRTHLATVVKNRCPVFKDSESYLLSALHGRALAEWMLAGSPDHERLPDTLSVLELASAEYEAGLRRVQDVHTIPDLQRVFSDAYSKLRTLGARAETDDVADQIRAWLDLVVAAKDQRKRFLGGEPPSPSVEYVSPDDCLALELILSDGEVPTSAVCEAFKVARLAMIPVSRFDEVVGFVFERSGDRLSGYFRPQHKVVVVPADPEPLTPKQALNRTIERVASARGGFFADIAEMKDDVPT